MRYIDYMQLNPFQRFGYNFVQFFKKLPGNVARFFKLVGLAIVNFFVGIGKGFANYGTRFVKGGVGVKISYVIFGVGNIDKSRLTISGRQNHSDISSTTHISPTNYGKIKSRP